MSSPNENASFASERPSRPVPVIGPRGTRRRIALVAHDNKKLDLLDWARFNVAIFAEHEVAIACNRATADYLVSSPLLDSDDASSVPNYESTEQIAADIHLAPLPRRAS